MKRIFFNAYFQYLTSQIVGKQIDDFITHESYRIFALKNGLRMARPNYLVTPLCLQTTS